MNRSARRAHLIRERVKDVRWDITQADRARREAENDEWLRKFSEQYRAESERARQNESEASGMWVFILAITAIVGTIIGVGIFFSNVKVTPGPALPDRVLIPCPTEDSDNCYWDATRMGNKQGTSFVTMDGVVYYPRGTE